MHRLDCSYYHAMARLAQELKTESTPKHAHLRVKVDLEVSSPLDSNESKTSDSSEENSFNPSDSPYLNALKQMLEKLRQHKAGITNTHIRKLIDSPLSNQNLNRVMDILKPSDALEEIKTSTQSPGAISQLKIKDDAIFAKMQEALTCIATHLSDLQNQKDRDQNLFRHLEDANSIIQSLLRLYRQKNIPSILNPKKNSGKKVRWFDFETRKKTRTQKLPVEPRAKTP